ncbi:MAG TPA: sigma factor-like helix-turn-helix DNA-binding protein [Solirubrobacteraceae bacterium]|nr:sigma factor-like helix-turn-helix DNA-binding protein [Solirubrobacteraceae bacterium]
MRALITPELRAAGITTEDELLVTPSTVLLDVLGPEGLLDLIVELRARGKGIASPQSRKGRVPPDREVEIFRLRFVEKRTQKQTGEAVGLGKERIRQITRWYFDLPPLNPNQSTEN